MRKAAGIILIVIGILQVIGMIISVIRFSQVDLIWIIAYWPLAYGALFITGGILCIRKKCWELCLTSALLALVGGIYYVVSTPLGGYVYVPWLGLVSVPWQNWILVIGALVSTIFISLSRKEWQEISDSADGKVSYGG